MAKEHRFDVVITGIRRGRQSRNGNPSFYIETEEGTFQTQSNASLSYALENYTNPQIAEDYVIGQQVTLVTTWAERVYSIEWDGRVL